MVLDHNHIIMKLFYQKPETEALEVGIEGMLCLSGGVAGNPGEPGAAFDPGDVFEYDSLF